MPARGGDPYKQVIPGDPVEFPALAFNAMLEAARQAKADRLSSTSSAAPQFRQSTIVLVQNLSGSDQARANILGISGSIIGPVASLSGFQEQVAFTGVTPAAATHQGRFVILLDPIANGTLGRAIAAGVAIVQLNVSSGQESYQRAEISDGQAGYLVPSLTGSAQILFPLPPMTDGVQWAVVLIGAGSDSGTLATVEDNQSPDGIADDVSSLQIGVQAINSAAGLFILGPGSTYVETATIVAHGTNYKEGDVVTIAGGTHTRPTQVLLHLFNGTGAKVAQVIDPGQYTVEPSNPVSVTGGSGSSLTLNLTWGSAPSTGSALLWIAPANGQTFGLVGIDNYINGQIYITGLTAGGPSPGAAFTVAGPNAVGSNKPMAITANRSGSSIATAFPVLVNGPDPQAGTAPDCQDDFQVLGQGTGLGGQAGAHFVGWHDSTGLTVPLRDSSSTYPVALSWATDGGANGLFDLYLGSEDRSTFSPTAPTMFTAAHFKIGAVSASNWNQLDMPNVTIGATTYTGRYVCQGTPGVSGTTLEGDTVTGGIITAIGASKASVATGTTGQLAYYTASAAVGPLSAASYAGGTLTLNTATIDGSGNISTSGTLTAVGAVSFGGTATFSGATVSASGIVTVSGSTTLSGNAVVNQHSNGDDALTIQRKTDTSPTGNALNVKNAAGASLATVDASGNVSTSGTLTAGGNVSFGGTATFSGATVSASGIVTVSGSTTLSGNAIVNQHSNGDDTLAMQRKTDSSPTGNFENYKNAAGASLWTVDITGRLTTGTVPAANVSGGATCASAKTTGTTTNSFASAVALTSTNGLHGSLSIRNTGGTNGMVYQLTVTDMNGNTGTTLSTNVNANAVSFLDIDYLEVGNASSFTGAGINSPLKNVTIKVQDAVSGNHTTFEIWDCTVS